MMIILIVIILAAVVGAFSTRFKNVEPTTGQIPPSKPSGETGTTMSKKTVEVPAFSRPVSEIADFFEENNQIEYIEAYIKYLYDFRVDVPLEVVEYIYSFWKKQIRYKRGWRYLPNYEQTPIIENCLAGYNIAVIGETNAEILESIINKVGGKYTGAQYDSDTNIIIIHFKFQKLEIEGMEKYKGARFKIMSEQKFLDLLREKALIYMISKKKPSVSVNLCAGNELRQSVSRKVSRNDSNNIIKDFIAIDFETATGNRNSACSLAAVKVVNGVITESHSWLFQPPDNDYTARNTGIHGITPEMTERLGNITDIYDHIVNLLSGQNVVAHNAPFDKSVLEESFAYYGLELPDILQFFDTCKMGGGKTLSECCAEYEIPLRHHDALSDATACAQVFMRLSGIKSDKKEKSNIHYGDKDRRISSETLASPDLSTVENKDTVFYAKKVVITGTFERYPVRERLAVMLKGYGADIQTSISRRTDIVVKGEGAGPAKMKKIKEINEAGGNICVMDEDILYKCIDEIVK